MRKDQRSQYWIVHHKQTPDVYIQTASKTEEEAIAAAVALGLGRPPSLLDANDVLVSLDINDEVSEIDLDEEVNFTDPEEVVDENLAVDLFVVRFADYYSVDEENLLSEAEYLVAVKAFKDLLAAQTTDSARALIIGTANKMRLDLIIGDIL